MPFAYQIGLEELKKNGRKKRRESESEREEEGEEGELNKTQTSVQSCKVS